MTDNCFFRHFPAPVKLHTKNCSPSIAPRGAELSARPREAPNPPARVGSAETSLKLGPHP